MKKNDTPIMRLLTISFMLFLVSALALFGQTPTTFNYQAVLRNSDGTINSEASVSIQLKVHQGTASGTIVYSETHNTTTSEFGMVNLEVGSVTPATFEAIDWSDGPYFVEVVVNGTSMGTSELQTVPYALYAISAENFTETDPVYAASEAANITAVDITKLSNLSGINTGDQNISGIASNASAITVLQAEQTAQNTAIALNTAKVGLSPSQITLLGNTSGINTGDQDGSETHVNAGTNVNVTGTGTSGNPYVVSANGVISYSISSATNRTIASTSTSTGDAVQLLQITGVPAGTYAVFFSCPVSNTSTSSNGINLAWSIETNDGVPSFPSAGVASSFIPATGWTANFIFGQSGFKIVTLGATGTIELVGAYYGNLLTGSVAKVGTAYMRAIRL